MDLIIGSHVSFNNNTQLLGCKFIRNSTEITKFIYEKQQVRMQTLSKKELYARVKDSDFNFN